MLEAMNQHGLETHLLCYDHYAYSASFPFPIHRLSSPVKDPSLRSGPSWRKVLQDIHLISAIRRLAHTLRPTHVVAHHVEAALASLMAGIKPLFIAHTQLDAELPMYVSNPWHTLAQDAGAFVESALVKHSLQCAAVSPRLAQTLQHRHNRNVRYLPIPWPLAEAIQPDQRDIARVRFGFGSQERVLLYTGNLDAYQGWEILIPCLKHVRLRGHNAYLLVATESCPEALLALAWQSGMSPYLRVTHLHGEHQRRLLSACADVVTVPRLMSAGVPVKLLDALARGIPTVCVQTATGGLSIHGKAHIAMTQTTDAMTSMIEQVLDHPQHALEIALQGRAYIASHHTPGVFMEAFRHLSPALQTH